jgi:hypothetical protein
MKYAILNATGTAVREVREYAVLPPTRPGMVRPLVSTPVPPHNQRTHQATLGYSIAPTQVTETWTVTQRPSILPGTWTPLEFLGRFTTQEMDQIESRQAADPIVRSFYRAASFATEIVSDDPRTVAGMDYLQSIGILTAARKDAILNGA